MEGSHHFLVSLCSRLIVKTSWAGLAPEPFNPFSAVLCPRWGRDDMYLLPEARAVRHGHEGRRNGRDSTVETLQKEENNVLVQLRASRKATSPSAGCCLPF